MLNIGKLAHGGAEYYLTAVASSIEAYYTGAGEAPGRWLGAASGRLGLAGLVTLETLRTVLSGADPTDGQPLVGHARTVVEAVNNLAKRVKNASRSGSRTGPTGASASCSTPDVPTGPSSPRPARSPPVNFRRA